MMSRLIVPPPMIRGVTLLELMLVLAIIGAAIAVSIPNIQSTVANTQSRKLSDDLQLDISFARSQSVTLSDTVSVVPISNNWSTGWRVIQGSNELRSRGSLANPIADNGTITSGDYNTSIPISFDRKGRAVNTGSVRILVNNCLGLNDRTITISQIGQLIETVATCP